MKESLPIRLLTRAVQCYHNLDTEPTTVREGFLQAPRVRGEARWKLFGTAGSMANKPTKKPAAKMLPEFKTEAEEAEWYATPEGRRQTRREFEKALKNGIVHYSPGEKVQRTDPAILQELMEQAKAKATRLIAIRVPVLDLERAEAIAHHRGVGYQAVLKEAIREGLSRSK